MKISEEGKNFIKLKEGLKLETYKCSSNVSTIGYGHTGSDVHANMKITKEQAEKLFAMDIQIHENNINKLVKVPLTQGQFDALVSFEFNIGYGAFKNSTLLKLLNAGKYRESAEQFTRWVYSGGKISAGLQKRREEEKRLFLK